MASSTVRIAPGTKVDLLTTELNTLANNTVVFAGGSSPTTFDNTVGGTNQDGSLLYDAFQTLGGALSGTPTVNYGISVWLLRTIDGGSTFEASTTANGSTSSTAPVVHRSPDFVFTWAGLSSPPTLMALPDLSMPSGKFRVLAWSNGAGVSMPSANNKISITPKLTTVG